ncbi:nitrile hydratase accessory protein [Epibacterium ulvae]|uniref:nitrile hydratase accessory protein n=1 Tax=Epibacterium ulvae TaxID=1156985 RepID=UPI001BFC4C78|nr:nitrile hydratase accessory protein [Epibacterium ulvae]MBT8154690.1 nitrile hydratase accessory protein [Epibacterium ulvae]
MNTPKVSDSIRCIAEATLPRRSETEPLFRKDWHARVFTLVVTLVHTQKIPWKSFQERLVVELAKHQTSMAPQTDEEVDLQYFDCWLAAAEETLRAEELINAEDVIAQIKVIKQTVHEIRDSQLIARS